MKTLLNTCGVSLLAFTAIVGVLMRPVRPNFIATACPISLIILIVVGLILLNRPAKSAPVSKLDDMLDQADKMKGNLRK